MNDELCDALVVGAGPSGALAARELARGGVSVILVDRSPSPRSKVCGCCINAEALNTLRRLGVEPGARFPEARALQRAHVRIGGARLDVPLPGGLALSRAALDAGLAREAVRAGARFHPRTRATLAPSTPGSRAGRAVRLEGPTGSRTVLARWVLAADGLSGSVSAALGRPRRGEVRRARRVRGERIGAGRIAARAPSYYERGTVTLAGSRDGYIGLVRIEGDRLDLACALDPAAIVRSGGIGPLADAILERAGLPPVPESPEGPDEPWRATPRLHHRSRRIAAERVIVLGDAARFVEPFTGQGISWALASAAAAAPLVLDALAREKTTLEGVWEKVWHREVERRQTDCTAIAWLLRHPTLAGGCLRTLSAAPGLTRAIIGRLSRVPRRAEPLSGRIV